MGGGYSHERKHLLFLKQERPVGKKTDTWDVRNRDGQRLATVVYRPGWRCYVMRWAPLGLIIDFDAKCMKQAMEFLDKQTAELKATWKKKDKGKCRNTK